MNYSVIKIPLSKLIYPIVLLLRQKNDDTTLNNASKALPQGLGECASYLRQSRRQRRRRSQSQAKRGVIPNRVGIEHRPPIADEKTERGHWEGDTIIGANHFGSVVTYVDKASKFLVAQVMKNYLSKRRIDSLLHSGQQLYQDYDVKTGGLTWGEETHFNINPYSHMLITLISRESNQAKF